MWLASYGRNYYGGGTEASSYFTGSSGTSSTGDMYSLMRLQSQSNELSVVGRNAMNLSFWIKPDWGTGRGFPSVFFSQVFENNTPTFGPVYSFITLMYDTETGNDSFEFWLKHVYEVDGIQYSREEIYVYPVSDINQPITGLSPNPSGRNSWNGTTSSVFTNITVLYKNEYWPAQANIDDNFAEILWNGVPLQPYFVSKVYSINGASQGGNNNPNANINFDDLTSGVNPTYVDVGALSNWLTNVNATNNPGWNGSHYLDSFQYDTSALWPKNIVANIVYAAGSPGSLQSQGVVNPGNAVFLDMQSTSGNWYDPNPFGGLNVSVTQYKGTATGAQLPIQNFANYVP